MAEIIEVLISEIKDYLERERHLKFTISGRNLVPEFSNWRTDCNAFILIGENSKNIPGVGIMFLKGGIPQKSLCFVATDLANPDTNPNEVVHDVAKHIIKFYCGPWTEAELDIAMRGY